MSDAPLILLIDGDTADREYYTQRLHTSSPDFVVVHAASGQSGLALCKRQSIDCVILELDLPDMSGFQLLLRLIPSIQHPEIAVIVLTRIPNQYLLDAAIQNGAHAALHKPMASGDILYNTVLKAIATVQKDRKRFNREIAI